MDAQADPGLTMSDPSVTAFLTQLLCAHGGRLAVSEIQQHLSLPPAHIAVILREESARLRLLERNGAVLVQSSVRLCSREQCRAPGCGRLHLCRYYLLGTCYRSRKGNVCPFPHDIQSEANKAVLKVNELNYLDENELKVLLLLNDPAFLPEVCKDYQGEQKMGACPKGVQCNKLHVCRYFLRGQCSKPYCTSSHNLLDPGALQVMEARRLSKEMSQNIQLLRCGQCIEAQNALRNSNIKGFSSLMTPNLDLRGSVNPFFPLFPLTGRSAVLPGTAPLIKIPSIHQPITQVPVDYLSLVPPLSVPVPSISSSLPNRSVAQVGPSHPLTASAGPESTPITGAPRTSQAEAKHKKKTKTVQVPLDPLSTTETQPGTPQYAEDQQPSRQANTRLLKSILKNPLPAPQISHFDSSVSLESAVAIQPATATEERQPGTTQYAADQQPSRPFLKSILKNPLPAPQISHLNSSLSLESAVDIQPATATEDDPPTVSQMDTPLPTVALKDLGDPNEICLYHIWKFCRNLNKCTQMHYYLPYRWQILADTGEWKDLTSMEDIEKAYSDPNNISTKLHNIDFQKMTSSLNPVQRLSTASSVMKPPEYILTTEWVWYWKNEWEWTEYGKQGGKERASVASSDLESTYLKNKKSVLQFEAGSQKYEISFEDMVQVNLFFRTKRAVLRRPRFVSQETVKRLKANVNQSVSSQTIPVYWDQTAVPSVGYELVDIDSGSSEFKEIQCEFERTLNGYTIQEIKRIQNPSLWQAYQMQLKKMKTLNKEKEVLEEKLFHGASGCHVDIICRENIDWRNYDCHAVLYGQGSYFSKDAHFSHQCCQSNSNVKTMFRARVLVGDFVTGRPSYMRPPPKPTNPRQTYDSCVDNEHNPSIFVIFEKHQHYPDYILKYTEDKVQSITPLYTQPKITEPPQVKSPKKVVAKEQKKCCIS